MRTLRLRIVLGLAALLACSLGVDAQQSAPDALKFASFAESKAEYDRSFAPFVAKHCGKCHNAKTSEGELDLAALDPDMKASTSAGRWAMVLKKLVAREMPRENR